MTVCEEIGHWAAGLRRANVPERPAERARLQRLSILAAGHAGEQAAEGVAAAAPEGPLGEAYRGAAASIAHDWDDYLFMGHPGHSSVWVARAFSSNAERALVAQIAADEVAGRLGAALLLGPHNGQFWSSIHCASAALAAGVGLGLDGDRLSHALAIALYQPPYGLWPGFMGPSTKLLTAAEPAAQGARAAMLAADGMDGPLGIIEEPRGLLNHLSFLPRPAMLGALGHVWLTDTLAFKPFPGCAYLQAAVEALLAEQVLHADIAEVRVDAGLLTVAMERLGKRAGLTPVGVNFSVARSIAIAAIAGRLTQVELTPEWLTFNAPAVEELASRIRVVHDWDMTLETLRGFDEGGATIGDVPFHGWRRVVRRVRELHMNEISLTRRDLRQLAERPAVRRQLWRLARRGGAGLGDVDTDSMRMRFPCRLHVRLRSGRVLELEREERGGCGRPLAEQRTVVEDRCRAAGLDRDAVLHDLAPGR
jgi:hypothetical protein